jgi:predicted Zn-dependent protease
LVGTAILGQEVLGLPGQQIMDLGSSAAQLLFLSYSRDAERESDRLGVEYAAKAGYASAEGAAFFTTLKRLSERAGQSIPSHLSSHPDPGEREKDIVNRAERWKERGLAQPNVMQKEFYSAIEGMMLGDNPREGFTDGGFFYHPEMAFQFPVPDNFIVINERSQVVLVTRDQKAVTIFSMPGHENTAEVVDEIGNLEDVTVISREQLSINGETAHRILGSMSDQNGNPFRIIVTGVNNGGQMFRFLSYSSEADFAGFESSFNRVSTGFARLTDSNKLAMQPARIRIVAANRTAIFSNFLPSEMPKGIDAEQLAIINQVELNETIPQGTLLKLPM